MEDDLQLLLDSLKSTVECLSMSGQSNTWEVCGGLDRLHSIMMNIFKHGCLPTNSNDNDAVWYFLEGLNWFHPTITSFITPDKNVCPKNEHLDKFSLLIYKSLENHTLSEILSWLLSDKDHLKKYYKPEAFLCQKAYTDAVLLCLQVVELNQPSLLLKIDPKLYLNYSSKSENCTTLPKSTYKQTNIGYVQKLKNPLKFKLANNNDRYTGIEYNNDSSKYKIKHFYKRQCHKSWPDIYKIFDRPKLKRSMSFNTLLTDYTPEDYFDSTQFVKKSYISPPELLNIDYEQLLNDNVDLNDSDFLNENKLNISHSDLPKQINHRSKLFTLPLRILEESDHDDDTLSIISDESRTLIPYDEFPSSNYMRMSGLVPEYFPGQDLFRFLSSGQFVQANAELDRENAHFKISEAIISTIEQIKCNQKLNFSDKLIEESDEEINQLKQRIRWRRQKLEIEQMNTASSFSDYLTESTLTDQTMSSLTSSYCSTTSSLSTTTDDMDDFELDSESNCSVNSLFSNVDRIQSPGGCSMVTAESVALSLIRHITNKNNWLVDVNVQWLISEADAPQQILPLPSSWPVNPKEPEDLKGSSKLRGTNDWAPPRPQIIFTCHPSPIRKKLMEHQNYRCAGCAMNVAVKYASKFRYCFYLGRYFCTGCHIDKKTVIPGRIIAKWDFSKYPVSSFSYALLEQIGFDPLFDIADLNSTLYKRARALDQVRSYRLQLYYIKDFIITCRYANRLKKLLDDLEAHIILKPDLYSIQNMLDVKNGELSKKLKNIIITCKMHITNCQLCQARGFICEMCTSEEILFPWDFTLVTRCVDCGTCYHKKCFNSRKVSICPRCPRMAMFKRADRDKDSQSPCTVPN
ncbi:Putative zinc-RING and/or ribbon,RUN domain,Zinc finger, RING/FYVE/PHD-type [Cinara cedri]|uniref:Zinc-RING and/or ribbon,RUN domain,Zinc finger, RING/FYVE/PHD-type n=1 Tax=Cinara cedri TaxID=506608 RepID=A0A5E4MEB3_9HEMI|nr:Putative zinc-RING and/or ribbon,RUN domain,Zinc finger, RING/FYVE/PHD-type [Cinara cedri]